ncbi:Aste57867_10178 [Aphanomyces stellatus]|uniref:Aste57867_10178 protein n=1 Tax=Aphanomyces stellatus TaxID=120398 RepID=A0A485KQ61_9STRA|nr:hypothetical protein As57867_010139 [Aphanomyces stellatus]VFT87054.1 Aste57867_10178 [Aphanomyces stellatus]
MPKSSTSYQGLASPTEPEESNHTVPHPFAAANPWLKATFSWANPLLALGNQRQLAPSDIWAVQDSNSVGSIFVSFSRVYERCDRHLLKTFFKIYTPKLVLLGLLQLLSAGCDLFGPSYVLPQILKTVQAPVMDWTRAFLLVVALYAMQLVGAVLKSHLQFVNEVIGIQFTAFLRSKLYKKVLYLSAASRTEKTAGDLTNLFSVDVVKFVSFSANLNLLWIVPLQITVVLVLIYHQVGWAAYMGLATLACLLLLTMIFGMFVGKAQKGILMAKDNRMKVINELFGAIQVIKFNAWEEKFAGKVLQLRDAELAAIRTFVRNAVTVVSAMYTAPVLITVVMFATYALWMDRVLTVPIVFTTLALLKTLQEFFFALPQTIVSMVEALVSANRIADILAMDERHADNVQTPANLTPSEVAAFRLANVAIDIADGSFGWNDGGQPLFGQLNWLVRRGEFVVVHGSVGAGKSSLCSILLGEMPKTSGSVFVGGRIAYFSQESWIQNATVRENILFAKPYDAAKYRKVLDACALTADMAALPAGDRTEIGLKGVNLSGGQRARVSLARACYSDADIFVLDAPLAALDATVAHEVFEKCFLGLLKHKTIVLVTHNPDVIASSAIDRAFLLQDGQLIESGQANGRVDTASLVSPLQARQAVWDMVDEDTWTTPQRRHDLLVTPTAQSPHGFEDDAMLFTPRQGPIAAPTWTQEALVIKEARAEGRVSLDVVRAYVSALGGWFAICMMLFWTAATEGVRVGSDMWLTHWSNTASATTPDGFRAASPHNLTVYVGLVLAMCALTVIQIVVVLLYGIKGSKTLFEAMLHGVLQAPMRFFDTNPIGRVLNRFGDDVFQCDIQLPMSFAPILVEAAMAVSKLVTSIVIVQWMGLLLPPLLYVYVKLGSYFLAPLREVNRIKKVTLSPLLSLVGEAIGGAVVIRAFGDKYQRRFVRLHDQDINVYSSSCFALVSLNAWFTLRLQCISGTIVFAILLGAVVVHRHLSPGMIGLVITYGLNIPANLAVVVNKWANLETALIAPERMVEYATVPHEGARNMPADDAMLWPTQGRVEFDQVSFRYKLHDPLVLQNVSFSIRGGEKIGVVGRTGAGKSSLVMALFRINDIASGSIKIDGVDTATVGLKALRSSLAIIPQIPVLFKGTLRNYLDPFDAYNDDQLWTVLRKVHMTDRIATSDVKLIQLIDENGDNFSVGERQMLCMARALLHQAKVVVLDEATAAMDHETDQHLQKVIRDEFAKSTVIAIAHRLDTVLDYDRIFVLDKGEIVQSDTPSALIQQANGIFYDMVADGGYLERL